MVPTLRLIRLLALGAPLWLLGLLVPGGWLPGALYLALIAVLCARDLRGIPPARELSARREMPPRFSLDQEHPLRLVIANRSRYPIHARVRDELNERFELTSAIPQGEIPATGEARLSYRVRPLRRGAHRLGDVVLRARGPLGLVERQIRLGLSDTVKVYPNFRGVDHYQLLAKIDQREEAARRPRRTKAPGTDFESLRPYVRGEDLKNIDWKATARRGALISRNRQVEKGQQLAILVDTGRLMGATIGRYSRLEHALSATVMLSFVAHKRGDALAVGCFSNRVEAFLPPVRGPALVPRVLETIYAVQAQPVESDYWQGIAQVMSMLRRRSLVILLTDVLDASGSAGLINNLARAAAKHLVLCVVLVEPRVRAIADSIPESVGDAYRKAAAADLLRRRRLALERMRARGILILETDPEHLSVHLVRRYLEIRQADLQ
ncbi:MAG TPA: DUF58 domain-containing protein [Candidatus Acidoferrales bacterium]|nr:DUF58 domain-containing protein [Candidatus Acidoferrales bacterium]